VCIGTTGRCRYREEKKIMKKRKRKRKKKKDTGSRRSKSKSLHFHECISNRIVTKIFQKPPRGGVTKIPICVEI
jgi:hypothetical protein